VIIEFISEHIEESMVLLALVPISIGLTRLMISLGPRLGLIDHPGERRIHETPIPRAGGVALFLGLLIGTGLLLAFGRLADSKLTLEWLSHFFIGATILFVIGVIDDRWGLSAWIKLGGQVAAALVLYYSNPRGMGNLMGFEIPMILEMMVHVGWVVALVNAFNLIDGMDGLCAGLGTISISIIAVISAASGAVSESFFAGVMIVLLLGFLRYNFHPARIFLGDTGSMLIGFFIASLGQITVGRGAVVAGILLPLLVGGVPLLDVTLAVWRRAARRFAVSKPGQAACKIFGADQDHLHHRILGWGLTQRQAAFTIYAMAGILSLIALLPILMGGNMLTLSAMGLIMIGLVGLRYVAPVEFMASGTGLRALIRRPRSSKQMVLGYFFYDLLAMTLAGVVSWWLIQKALRLPFSLEEMRGPLVVFVVCAILFLRFARAHSRRWTRGSVHDFGESLCWLICGVGFSFGILSATEADFSFRGAIFHLCAGGIGIVLFLIPRSIGVVFQEGVLDAMHRKRRGKGKKSRRTTLIYGAGDLGELFICHLRLSSPSDWRNDHFIGFMDDSEELTGRRMRGFPILGTLAQLPLIAEKHHVNAILVTSSVLKLEHERKLREMSKELGLELAFWSPDLGAIRDPAKFPDLRRPSEVNDPDEMQDSVPKHNETVGLT
jgi:UDP-N-acetylmuramyl pentapeptide phosphotransferase/UDP-N-acetylglucosamine-1-phosphate transferase